MKPRYGRDADAPQQGEVYESRWGNRWLVTGTSKKGRVLVKRAPSRYEGELHWTPAMLSKLKLVRGKEAKAVSEAVQAETKDWPPRAASEPSSFFNFFRDPVRPRRYHVYVIEQIRFGKREFYVGQTGKTPDARLKDHKSGGMTSHAKGRSLKLRKDLTSRIKPLYTREDAERMEKVIAKTLRGRGLAVRGGH